MELGRVDAVGPRPRANRTSYRSARHSWLTIEVELLMEIQKRTLSDGSTRWKIRWRQGARYRSRSFDRKGDAVSFGVELRRR